VACYEEKYRKVAIAGRIWDIGGHIYKGGAFAIFRE
jgi:hypothetical protein